MTTPTVELCGKGLHPRTAENRGSDGRCAPCKREYQQRRHTALPEYARERYRRWRDKLRAEMVEAYGGRCAVPGCDVTDEFELDHVNGDGAEHRRELFGTARQGGWAFYQKLRQLGWPQEGLQLLCGPHHREKSARESRERAAARKAVA